MNRGMNRGTFINHEKGIEGLINVFELATKEVVFTGTKREVAVFLGTYEFMVHSYLKNKTRFRKKYAIRHAKKTNNKEEESGS